MTIMGGVVDGPRERILEILRRREGVGVTEFARELGLSGATVRRHLDVLRRNGHVSVSQVREGAGRPRYAFSLTEAGAEQFPHHYVRLTHRLIEEIVALSADETVGRGGAALAELVFDKMAERLARECGPRVQGDTLAERARSAAELLSAEGFDFDVVVAAGDAVQLLGRGCPCRRLARSLNGNGSHPAETCDHDRLLLEQVLDARVTPLPPSQMSQSFLCGYRVVERADTADDQVQGLSGRR